MLKISSFCAQFLHYQLEFPDPAPTLIIIEHNLLSDSVASTTVSGLAAGSLSSLVTHPADVVKTRVQLQNNLTERAGLNKIIPALYKVFYCNYGMFTVTMVCLL